MTTRTEISDNITVNLSICKAVAEVMPEIKTATVRNECLKAMSHALGLIESNFAALNGEAS